MIRKEDVAHGGKTNSGAPNDRYTITQRLQDITWNTDEPTKSLEEVYRVVDELTVSEIAWYRRRLTWRRRGTHLMQVVAAALLVIGVVLPIVSASFVARTADPDWRQAYTAGQLGYAALVVAALLLLMDQVFLFSRAWRRYLVTEQRLFSHLLHVRFLWLSFQAEWGKTPPPHDQVKQALDLLVSQATEAQTIVRSETDTWATELQQGLETLRSRIDIASAAAEAQAKVVQTDMVGARDLATGTIAVEVRGVADNKDFPVVLRGTPLLRERQTTLVSPSNVIFENLPAGKYVVSVGTDAVPEGRRQHVVHLAKGGDEHVAIDFSR